MNFTNRLLDQSNDKVMKTMRAGDLAIVYMGHSNLEHIYLKPGDQLQNKFGSFPHNEMIGKPFGTKFKSRISAGWVYILEPSPELWSLALNTRTQIVNEVDSSIIVNLLDIYPGCRVVESGTGSGCMTISIARAIYPTGHVYTFEYNQVRARIAQEEFDRLHLSDVVSVSHRDICGKFREDEAGFKDIDAQSIDSIFFDLPEPWLALPYAMHVLKPSRNICCYSPCIEQVIRTCDALRELGFYNISMIEVRQRPYDGRIIELEHADLGLDMKELSSHNDDSDEPSGKRQKTNEAEGQNSESKSQSIYPIFYKPRVFPTVPTPVARPIGTMKGHSAFLTFALRPTADMLRMKENKHSTTSTDSNVQLSDDASSSEKT